MIATNPQRHRLQELIQFAAAFRGWTTKQLGEALDRDPSNVVPESGTPKIDLVIRLANALDWPAADLLEHLSEPLPGCASPRRSDPSGHANRKPRGSVESTGTAQPGPELGTPSSVDLNAVHAEMMHLLETDELDAAIDLAESIAAELVPAQPAFEPLRSRPPHFASDRFSGRPTSARLAPPADSASASDAIASLPGAPRTGADDAMLARIGLAQSVALVHRGRPMRALAALQRSVTLARIEPSLRVVAMSHLAEAYHRTGQPIEASAIAAEVIETITACEDVTGADLGDESVALTQARAHMVRGACVRDRLLEGADDLAGALAAEAELNRAAALLEKTPEPEAIGMAIVVDAGRAAMRVCAGLARPTAFIAETMARLDAAVDPASVRNRAVLAGLGWWCAIGGAVALRTLPEGPELHRTLAILTNKADELAAAVDCWALRERVLMLEVDRRARLSAFAGHEDPWLLDRDDLRLVIGCMGASRRFRPLGLQILRSAMLVDDAAG